VIRRATRRLARGALPTASDIRRLLRSSAPEVVAQPILDLSAGEVTGYEALARFPEPAAAEPQAWFDAAHRSGLGPDLEARAIAQALELGGSRPAGTILSVNVSPSVLDTAVLEAVLPKDLSGLQFEITEHELADDAGALVASLDRLRRRGAQIAVDDVGEGYAGLKRVMRVRPEVLKIDRAIVAGVSSEPAKAALLEAVVHYAARTGAQVCAEGLETIEDLATVADLDVALAQGWVVGRPAGEFYAASTEARTTLAAAHAGGLRGNEPAEGDPRDVVQLLNSLAHASDLAEAIRRIKDAASLLGCEQVRLAVLDSDGTRLAIPVNGRSGNGDTRPLVDSPTARLVLAERVIGQVLASTAGPDDGDGRLLAANGCRSLLLLPLVSAGRTVGVLECFRVEERPWSRAQLRTARTVAAAVGPVADNLYLDRPGTSIP
jgi:EAL domain-containing protein (putative c-di-GMP-specific phosphodiesterase class I)